MEKNENLTNVECVNVFVRNIITPEDLREWQRRMGYTYDDVAREFGINRATFAGYLKGTSRVTNKDLPLPRVVALAAMAVEMGLHKKLPPAQIRQKSLGRKQKNPQSDDDDAVHTD